MSSYQENQDQTTKSNTNVDESAVKRKKTRPNQRKRRQISILKAQLKESEAALLTKEGPLILPSNGCVTTTSSFGAKSPDIVKKKEPRANSPKKDLANNQNFAGTTANQKPSSILPVAITNSNSKAGKTSNTKIDEKQKNINSLIKNQPKILQDQTHSDLRTQPAKPLLNMSSNPNELNSASGKTREDIMAEREAKKLAKQAKKTKLSTTDSGTTLTKTAAVSLTQKDITPGTIVSNTVSADKMVTVDKTREEIKAERDAKKKAKQALKVAKASGVPELAATLEATKITENQVSPTEEEKKKPTLSKAERRALQEAQRAAKTQAQKKNAPSGKATSSSVKQTDHPNTPVAATLKASPKSATCSSPAKSISPLTKSQHINDCKVRLFNHLEKARHEVSLFLNDPHIHPSVARLGEQYAQRTVVGSNARCIAFLNALKMVIRDFETPPKKEFARSLETTITNSVEHLQKCRPLAVSVSNAYKHIKHVLTQLPTDQSESDLKDNLCHFIDTYIENQIGKAAEAISYSVQEKISNGDVILTFGCSSLITFIFEEAQRRRVDFRVIIVDSRPFCEGQELLRRLTVKEIPCSYVLINAISFVMPEATKVLLGAHALLANGYVMARTGTAQVALVAHSFNVPVLVCCETHKFSERSQTDAIVYNELGNPDDLIRSDKCSLTNWQVKGKMVPLNLMYDITPPELVTAVVTEVSILPCTSVPVILRIKPTEIGY